MSATGSVPVTHHWPPCLQGASHVKRTDHWLLITLPAELYYQIPRKGSDMIIVGKSLIDESRWEIFS